MSGPQARLLPNGRLHLQHGPIDLVVEAVGSREAIAEGPRRSGAATPNPESMDADADRGRMPDLGANRPPSACMGSGFSLREPRNDGRASAEVRAAYDAATRRFATLLTELCDELPALRSPAGCDRCRPRGPVARRMTAAVAPFAAEAFITPMAAVAGAVAEEVLEAMMAAAPLRRASVNNGGDVALHLGAGETVRIGLVDRPDRPGLYGTATLSDADGIGGIATSGWRGRSFSLGIADAVTILARTAAAADAAATIVANAVDLTGHPAVERVPARQVQEDSDLGEMLVTRGVATLTTGEVEEALSSGLARAEALVARGLVFGAALHLQGRTVATNAIHPRRHAEAGRAGLLSMTPSGDVSILGRAAA